MPCAKINQLPYGEFLKRLDGQALDRRIPHMGTLILTYRCNLACAHCYCNLPRNDASALSRELSTAETCRIIDEMADAGCLWLLLTGGEPLLRPDFLDIYAHAVHRGMFVQIFTNGTLVTPNLAGRLQEFPPLGVGLSIYGATEETHDRVTRTPGSLRRTRTAINLLLEAHVDVSLKTVLTSLNVHELAAIKDYAASLGPAVDLLQDAVIVSRLDGGLDNRGLRLSPEAAAALDTEDERRFAEYRELHAEYAGIPARDMLLCGGGLFSASVDPYGKLQPCDSLPHLAYDIREGSFTEGWQEAMPRFRREMEATLNRTCLACDMVHLCSNCSGYSSLEHRSTDKVVESLCRKTHLMYEKLHAPAHPSLPAQTVEERNP